MISNFYPKLENWINSDEYKEKKKQEIKDISAIKKFLKKYNKQSIEGMIIKEYLVNYGDNSTFCGELKSLVGGIGGHITDLQLFGLVWNKKQERTERNDKYNCKRLGKEDNIVFENLKKNIVKAIEDSTNGDFVELSNNNLNTQFVSKIAFVYNYTHQLPIYSKTHIDKLVDLLGIACDKKEKKEVKRQLLFEFWRTDEFVQAKKITPISFMYFIYSEQGYASILKEGVSKKKNNIRFCDGLVGEKIPFSIRENPSKQEYLTEEKKKIIGTRGEEKVFEYLMKNKSFFGIKGDIEVFCYGKNRDDTKGYDFSYSTKDGERIYVEAKTTTLNLKDRVRFEMSRNEYNVLLSNPTHYYVFFVNDLDGDPTIERFRGDSLVEPDATKFLFQFELKKD